MALNKYLIFFKQKRPEHSRFDYLSFKYKSYMDRGYEARAFNVMWKYDKFLLANRAIVKGFQSRLSYNLITYKPFRIIIDGKRVK